MSYFYVLNQLQINVFYGRGKMKKRLIIFMLVFCFLMGQVKSDTAVGASAITERKFVVLLMRGMKLCNQQDTTAEIIQAACKKRIVKDADKSQLSKKLTKERAAIYLCRMDVKVNGSTYDEKKYKMVRDYNRISDLKSMKKASRASVIKMYCKGIMVGYSNGYYVQSRKFKGAETVTETEAKTYVNRLCKTSKRKAISPDGQLIRSTKLPKNASSYPYILATYPNWFYERTFEYQKTIFHKKPVALEDYASPVQIGKMKFYNGTTMETVKEQYLMNWCKKVETNMKMRFNVDYRTIDSSWVNELRKTYYVFEDAETNKSRTDDIKEYVRNVKKNKIVVKASRVTVEPSSLYYCSKDYIRVYVKFKIVRGDSVLRNSIYNENSDLNNLKEGKWIEKCFDIGIGSYNGYSTGLDYAVVDNNLLQA